MKKLLNNKDGLMKALGVTVTLAGIGISIVQKQLDDKKLQETINREVKRQLKNMK